MDRSVASALDPSRCSSGKETKEFISGPVSALPAARIKTSARYVP